MPSSELLGAAPEIGNYQCCLDPNLASPLCRSGEVIPYSVPGFTRFGGRSSNLPSALVFFLRKIYILPKRDGGGINENSVVDMF